MEINGNSLYVKEANKRQIISKEEADELAIKVKNGDSEAMKRLVEGNLRLVFYVAKDYRNKGLEFGDLIGEGNKGLVSAAKRFDPNMGCSFSTFAYICIRNAITDALFHKTRIICLPVSLIKKIFLIDKIKNELVVELNHEPTNEEIAKRANLSVEETVELFKLKNNTISLNKKVRVNNSEFEFGELIRDERQISDYAKTIDCDNLKRIISILRSIDGLSPRSLEILLLRTGCIDGKEWSGVEVAKKYNLTRQRVQQIEANAYRRILKSKEAKILESYYK